MNPHLCLPFDLRDQKLIEHAHQTGRPRHIADAIEAAVLGFEARLAALGRPLVIEGRPHLMICKPRSFFDEYVVALVLQRIADQTGQVVRLYKTENKLTHAGPDSPDVRFTDLPEWIVGDDGGERDFVIHLHWPRFTVEFPAGTVTAIDPDEEYITCELAAGREPAQGMARLLREAAEFFEENA